MILDVKPVQSEEYELETLKMFPEFELPVVKASKKTILGKIYKLIKIKKPQSFKRSPN